MFRVPGPKGKDLCDSHLNTSRRDFLRVGGAGMLGLTLNSVLRAQSASASSEFAGGPGWVGRLEKLVKKGVLPAALVGAVLSNARLSGEEQS